MNDVFKFMTPEEIDEHIKALTNENPRRGGKGQPRKGRKRGELGSTIWSEADVMLRRQVVLDLLGQGLSKRRVCEEICSRWEVSASAAYIYYHDALDAMVADNKEVVEKYRDLQIGRLEALAEDALAHNDRKSALTCYEQLNKIGGLYTQKIEADVKEDTTIRFTFGE